MLVVLVLKIDFARHRCCSIVAEIIFTCFALSSNQKNLIGILFLEVFSFLRLLLLDDID